jgi:uncharacterized protein YaaN involved in tellurite resistance
MKPLFDNPTPAKSAQQGVSLQPDLNVSSTQDLPAVVSSGSTEVATVKPPRITDNQISAIGSTAGAGMAAMSTRILEHVRTSNTGEFGKDLNDMVMLAKGLDPAALQDKGFVSRLFGMATSAKERMLAQFKNVNDQITTLATSLEGKAQLHTKRIGDLEKVYNDNVAYHQTLEQCVVECSNEHALLAADYEIESKKAVGDSFGAQVLADYQRLLDRLEKRKDDLMRAMLLSKQYAPQVRMMQEDARALVSKFDSVKVVTLPAWQNTFTLYVLQLEQKQSVEVLNAVDDATDAALRKSADLLRSNSSAIATSRNRSVVSADTLQHVNNQLIGAVEDVQKIDAEGRARRAAEQPKLLEMEQQLIAAFAPGKR